MYTLNFNPHFDMMCHDAPAPMNRRSGRAQAARVKEAESLEIPFQKYHGYENDFIVVREQDLARVKADATKFARRVCDRHTGVGADGVMVWSVASSKEIRSRIFNRDGSEAETSGNGTRCLAAHVVRSGAVSSDVVPIRVPDGLKVYRLKGSVGQTLRFLAELGNPRFLPEEIPFDPSRTSDASLLPACSYAPRETPLQHGMFCLETGGRYFPVTPLSTGNPHCIVRVEDFEPDLAARWGPALEKHPAFPSSTNVEFVRVVDRSLLEARFWERGVGVTSSSGTGSAAAAVAAIRNGWADIDVRVSMTGGEVRLMWRPGEPIRQEGEAGFVFEGKWRADGD